MTKSKSKIIIASGIFSPDIGGPAIYSARLAVELAARDFDVEVLTYCFADLKTRKKHESFFNNHAVRILSVSRSKPKGLKHLFFFLKLWILAQNCDSIYAQNAVSAGLPAWLAARLRFHRKRLVVKIVGDAAWERARERGIIKDDLDAFQDKNYGIKIPFLKIRLLGLIQRWVSKGADSIIVPSKYLGGIVRSWEIDEGKIKVIYNSYDAIGETSPKKAWKNSILQLRNRSGPLIVSVGRLVSWKGVDELLEVMPDLAKEIPDLTFAIVGDGPLREALESKIQELNIKENVVMQGWKDHSDVMRHIGAADVFVLNSHYEGLPHVVLEAMASGTAIVATKVGGTPELIKDGVNGFLVEPRNKQQLQEKILELLHNRTLQQKFFEANKEKVKNFSFEKMMEETINVL